MSGLYSLYELQQALLTPARLGAEMTHALYTNPFNPLAHTPAGRSLAAQAEVFERATRRFGKPVFDLPTTTINGEEIKITEEIIYQKPFCDIIHFKRDVKRKDPPVLIVAPMSGHFATLLRGTVEALLPHHDVYITDWIDARYVPLSAGRFNLDDYIAYIMEFCGVVKGCHIVAVCQPAVPVFAAVALMEALDYKDLPKSMTLMGGPIDPRVSKTAVTELAETRPLSWFENSVINRVPFYYNGAYRRVYPGFIQLSGFMSMNLDRHVGSTMKFYQHLVQGDGDNAENHRKFYDEYLAVMDIPAEFYLQTVQTVFQKHDLPRGVMTWIDPATDEAHIVDPSKITRTSLLTIEGELDDISAHGQTTAAHTLCLSLNNNKQYHHFQESVGHYGIFNGRRWREQIMPRIRHFMRNLEDKVDAIPAADLERVPDIAPAEWDNKIHSLEAVLARKKASKPSAEGDKSGFYKET
jgi:poly(3-hydroxybutyrate) depolymerase